MTRCLVLWRAQPSAHRRIGNVKAGALHTAMFFRPEVRVIPAQTVIKGQLPRDLPTVLDIEAVGMVAQPQIRNPADLRTVRETQKEAGVAKSAAGRGSERQPELPG